MLFFFIVRRIRLTQLAFRGATLSPPHSIRVFSVPSSLPPTCTRARRRVSACSGALSTSSRSSRRNARYVLGGWSAQSGCRTEMRGPWPPRCCAGAHCDPPLFPSIHACVLAPIRSFWQESSPHTGGWSPIGCAVVALRSPSRLTLYFCRRPSAWLCAWHPPPAPLFPPMAHPCVILPLLFLLPWCDFCPLSAPGLAPLTVTPRRPPPSPSPPFPFPTVGVDRLRRLH